MGCTVLCALGLLTAGGRYWTRLGNRSTEYPTFGAIDHILVMNRDARCVRGGWVHHGVNWERVSDHDPVSVAMDVGRGTYGLVQRGTRMKPPSRSADLQLIRKSRVVKYQKIMRGFTEGEKYVQQEAGLKMLEVALKSVEAVCEVQHQKTAGQAEAEEGGMEPASASLR